ncbi:aldo/keto reductase [Halorussus caseinilyticus]|uniref:Aldo/keto reductase n=1 Tax=Halorussus caseinilyticus TaxID=3034025 RepID=A0ABD5WN54_9EURY|nr:aldo/keto reductase [Halorussus sp. DT72]
MTRNDLPPIGLGTAGNVGHEQCAETVRMGLEAGYRHVDTAQMYDNEAAVGDGLDAADVPRSEVSVATKVHPENLGYEAVHRSAAESADRLGVDTIDVLYVHWPAGAYHPEETLRAFDELFEEGAIGGVGLCNFTAPLLREALDRLDAPVVAHQVECHPLLPQDRLYAFSRKYDHALVAYAPLAQTMIFDHPAVESIAAERDLTPAQVCLAWLHGREGVVPIPKSTGRDHLEENFASLDVELPPSARQRLDGIEARARVIDPHYAPWK